jgi:hypothetical protein
MHACRDFYNHFFENFMTPRTFITTILALVLVSCSNNRTQLKPKEQTPEVLEDKASYALVSKRGYDDLVEKLYNELVSNDKDLKVLEDKIDKLNESKRDTMALFNKFDSKNQSYFTSANNHVSQIKDSIVRDKIKSLVASQLAKYNSQISAHSELIKIIEAKQITISDLHNSLKIVRTLSLIDKYQKDNLPNTKSLKGYIQQQEQTIILADTLLKK